MFHQPKPPGQPPSLRNRAEMVNNPANFRDSAAAPQPVANPSKSFTKQPVVGMVKHPPKGGALR